MRLKPSSSRTAVRLTACGAVAAIVLAGTGPSAAQPEPALTSSADHRCGSRGSWEHPNADRHNTRRVRGPIDSTNVADLEVAWTVPIKAPTDRWPGSYATNPIVVDGVMYSQDLDSNVYAIDVRTGREVWTVMMGSYTNGPNGVAVSGGRVFGATLTDVFALDARTGRELWRRKITRNANEGIDMAPGVNNNTVYIATVPSLLHGGFGAGAVGVVWAIDARTGATRWTWDTVPRDLWGHPEINSGGGAWYPPSFDERGDLYLAVSNPGPFLGTEEYPWGSSRPGPNLYTNSIVKLDGRTGRLIWYRQELPHDIYDWDLQNSPILTTVGGRRVVLTSGKTGFVYMYDRDSGKRLWKTPVGRHNGHDDDNLLAMAGRFDELPSFPAELYPGVLGGVPAPGAVDRDTVYVAVNDLSATWTSQLPPPIFPSFSAGSGAVVALDLATGRARWTFSLDQSPYGGTTISNDLVFTTTFDGTIHAFNAKNGRLAWRVKLPGSTNSPVVISGDILLSASGWPQSAEERAEIVAYRLPSKRGGKGCS
ncbi:PQQ-binding-like beta-propeller repeat protein [Micromonospora sp. WMMA1363]|uniref:outer membrane protein assembly factor BamB family protein n=1 Tax=Micromonospora sp. WMMA1363 TaxID=3053985 RepID=UPI00259C76BB|nr:PQQ-binding-like beta-propeller repeat protein [Micromonospora sp. WMMA1363]MDM4719671.1 PQQ-binding-like beta-propeller repeat protein [Micromonospora sp. WMMA1363]